MALITVTRITLNVPERVEARLRALAEERAVPLETVIIEALDEKSASYLPRPRTIGIAALNDGYAARDSNDGLPEPAPWRSL